MKNIKSYSEFTEINENKILKFQDLFAEKTEQAENAAAVEGLENEKIVED